MQWMESSAKIVLLDGAWITHSFSRERAVVAPGRIDSSKILRSGSGDIARTVPTTATRQIDTNCPYKA
jgi:hypothetical protein